LLEQSSFSKGTSHADNVHVIKRLAERNREVKQELYVLFSDSIIMKTFCKFSLSYKNCVCWIKVWLKTNIGKYWEEIGLRVGKGAA
jgi:hypothetical protein